MRLKIRMRCGCHEIYTYIGLASGKRVNEFSMLEDQRDILKKILTVVDERKAREAVFIAGDVYDKSIPPIEAIQLFDDFLCQLSEKKCRHS